MISRTLVTALVCGILFDAAISGSENLIRNGGFEDDLSGKPPSGWSMWGADTFKVPENFTADTANPHTGNALLKIVHPANTRGLIINTPQNNSICPKQGCTYTISFWAKSDTPGKAFFRLGSYKEINPFINGPVINLPENTVSVSPSWQQYTYTLVEGRDFFFDSAKYIHMMFYAAAKPEEARTLWLDDVVVTETADATATGMINDETLPYAPLPLRVTPGDAFSVAVSTKRILHPANRNVGGVSFHRVGGSYDIPYDRQSGAYRLTAEHESSIASLRLPLTRFYHVGAEKYPLEDCIDKIASVLTPAGIPQTSTILEFEDCWVNTMLSPDEWTKGIRHSLTKGYGFRYWEIGNETYTKAAGYGKAFPTTDDYIRHVKEVSSAIRTVHPSGQIGISVAMNTAKDGNYILLKAAGSYDFICPHYYGTIIDNNFEETVLGENHSQLNRMLQVNALLAAYNKGRDVYQYDSEWGLSGNAIDGKGPDDNVRNANIFGTVYRAVRLIYYTREQVLRGATAWAMFGSKKSPGFGVLYASPDDIQRSMLYWLYYYYNRSVGESVLAMSGSAPFQEVNKVRVPNVNGAVRIPMTPAVITVSEDKKKVFIIVANGSWTKNVPCTVTIADFAAAATRSVLLTHDDINAHPMLEKKDDFVKALPLTLTAENGTTVAFRLPPHAVGFIEVSAP